MNPLSREPAAGADGVPWDAGYYRRKFAFIGATIASTDMLRRFLNREPLPAGFGIGLDERCVEYPWALARVPGESGRLLDAGSACNHEAVIDHPVLRNKEVHILTLAPEHNCFWRRGISYLFADLRDIPTRDEFYDTVLSISTIEHLGMDNSIYTKRSRHREHDRFAFCRAMHELWRVLKPGGEILVTVPFGRYTDLGIAQQFDGALLRRLVDSVPAVQVETTFYRYDAHGWQISTERECGDSVFVGWVQRYFANPDKGPPSPIPVEADMAAAARAVACVRLRKGGNRESVRS